ncbi:MAG TPA: GNAT family N-acetyltransferase [Chloroflexia bacterium]|nr:GNAT family N-acetyltransferase [Chloroflexia bacterium]
MNSQHSALSTQHSSVEVVQDVATFAAMRGEWAELLDDSDSGPFNSWEWLYPWYRRIGSDRALRILVARDESGRLLGVMPLCVDERRVAGRAVRRVAFLGETYVGSEYLDIITRRGYEVTISQALIAALRDSRAGWDVLDLVDIDSQSSLLQLLRDAFPADEYEMQVTPRSSQPYEVFEPDETFDSFLRKTSRRENYLRRRKWLEKQSGYRIERVADPTLLTGPLTDLMRLHALRWEVDGGSEAIKGPSIEAFHRDATQLLAERGQLCMYTMKLGDQALASVYGIVYQDKFIYYLPGWDPAWRDKSVSLVLIGETFRDALDMGLREYDFLSGPETYKSDWVSKTRHSLAVRIYRKGSAGSLLARQESARRRVRDLAKRAMPKRLLERLRYLRQKRYNV